MENKISENKKSNKNSNTIVDEIIKYPAKYYIKMINGDGNFIQMFFNFSKI